MSDIEDSLSSLSEGRGERDLFRLSRMTSVGFKLSLSMLDERLSEIKDGRFLPPFFDFLPFFPPRHF